MKDKVMTDGELMDVLKIKKSKFYQLVKDGPDRSRHPRSRDIRLINHYTIGKTRYWLSDSVDKFITGNL